MEGHARRRELPHTEVQEGLVLYDADRRAAHSLSPVAAAVWRACDGRTPAAEMAAALGEDLAAVEGALHDLRAAHLLEPAASLSRRQALRRLGAVALAPAVVSIALPAVAHAQSCKQFGQTCLSATECCDAGAVCFDNFCEPCHTKNQACFGDEHCCPGLTCQSNSCQP